MDVPHESDPFKRIKSRTVLDVVLVRMKESNATNRCHVLIHRQHGQHLSRFALENDLKWVENGMGVDVAGILKYKNAPFVLSDFLICFRHDSKTQHKSLVDLIRPLKIPGLTLWNEVLM